MPTAPLTLPGSRSQNALSSDDWSAYLQSSLKRETKNDLLSLLLPSISKILKIGQCYFLKSKKYLHNNCICLNASSTLYLFLFFFSAPPPHPPTQECIYWPSGSWFCPICPFSWNVVIPQISVLCSFPFKVLLLRSHPFLDLYFFVINSSLSPPCPLASVLHLDPKLNIQRWTEDLHKTGYSPCLSSFSVWHLSSSQTQILRITIHVSLWFQIVPTSAGPPSLLISATHSLAINSAWRLGLLHQILNQTTQVKPWPVSSVG